MLEGLHLYGKFVAIAVRSRMQYRSDFLTGILGVFILSGVNIALIAVLLGRFQSLQGWGFWDIVLLYGMWLICHSVNAMFFWHLATLEDDIVHGRLDQYLTRPASPLLQFIGREFNYIGVADLLFGLVAFSTAYIRLGLAWTLPQWGYFALAIVFGALIEISIILLFSSASFWIGRSRALLGVVLQVSHLTPQYPLDIFGYGVRVFITAFVPFAFMNYYPLTVLLGKPNALGIWWVPFIAPLTAAVLATLAYTAWRRGLAVYTSAGN
jgi:ABC-2 type transport system permease protein